MKIIKYCISLLIVVVGWVVPLGFIIHDNPKPSLQFVIPFFIIAFFAILFLFKQTILFEKWFDSKLTENQNTL
jgi:hypothetical protein